MRILKYNDQRDTNHLYIKEEQAVSVCPKHKLAPLKTPLDWFRVTLKTPLPATSCQHSANPSFDARYPFTLRPKPSINSKKTVSTMEVLIFQKEAFEEMAAKFSRFSDRVNELLAKQGGKSLNRWMDNQEVCQQLNISPRTLQTLRDNGTLAYSQINHKVFYRPEDVLRIVKPVENKPKSAMA